MQRRQVLRNAALAGTLGVAGCISQSPSSGQGDESTDAVTNTPEPAGTADPEVDDATPTRGDDSSRTDTLEQTDTLEPTDSPTPSPIGGPNDEETMTRTPRSPPPMPDAVEDHTFEVTDSSCGEQTDTATIKVSGPEVVITGTIWGSDGCATAVLDAVELQDGELIVRVRETERDTDEMCVQCLVELDYETSFAFEDDAPDTVTVQHLHSDTTETVAST